MPRPIDPNDGTSGGSRPSVPRGAASTAGNPKSTSRKSSTSTKTTSIDTGLYPQLKSRTPGYTYENTWKPRYEPRLLPIQAVGMNGALVQSYLHKGYMVWARNLIVDDQTADNQDITSYGQEKYKFNFFYNPTQIDLANALYTNSYDPGAINDGATFQIAYPATETVHWTLLLDRTEEAYYNGDSIGTLQDLYVLYGLINGGEPKEGYDLGFLYMTPVTVNFGATQLKHDLGSIQSPDFSFSYTGYITSLNVTHQRFSQYMIPNMSTVDISLTRISQTQPTVHKTKAK